MNLRKLLLQNLHNFVLTSSENSIHMCGLNNKFISPFKKINKIIIENIYRKIRVPNQSATALYDSQKIAIQNIIIVRFANKRGR